MKRLLAILALAAGCALGAGCADVDDDELDEVSQDASAPPAFSDGFDAGTASWSVKAGTWSVVTMGTNKVYYQSAAGSVLARSLTGTTGWKNRSWAAWVRMQTVESGQEAAAHVGLRARYSATASSGYELDLFADNKLKLVKRVNGVATVLAEKPFTVQRGRGYVLKIDMIGSRLYGFVDGLYELTATDATFTGGLAGVGTSHATGYFDNAISHTAVWVDNNPNDNISAPTGQPVYPTIAEAMAAASVGGIVNVLPGTHQGPISFPTHKPLTLRAMETALVPVNGGFDPSYPRWPVVVRTTINDEGIRSGESSGDDLTIAGFYVSQAGDITDPDASHRGKGNGIHVNGNTTSHPGDEDPPVYDMKRICKNVNVLGNRVENTREDGIKIHQCQRVVIHGNRIAHTSLINEATTRFEKEHAIDFVAVGNSAIRNNRIIDSLIGIVVKTGSINVVVEGNTMLAAENPHRGPESRQRIWTAFSGEPPGAAYLYTCANVAPRYGSKFITVRNNTFTAGGAMYARSCQGCSYVNNITTAPVKVFADSGYVTSDVCVSGNKTAAGTPVTYEGSASDAIATSSCTTSWRAAKLVCTNTHYNTPAITTDDRGFDLIDCPSCATATSCP